MSLRVVTPKTVKVEIMLDIGFTEPLTSVELFNELKGVQEELIKSINIPDQQIHSVQLTGQRKTVTFS